MKRVFVPGWTSGPCVGASSRRYGARGGIAQQNRERRIIGTIIHWSKGGMNYAEIARELTARRIQVPHPGHVYRTGRPGGPRTPFYWTRDIVRATYRNWVYKGSIIPFIEYNL